MDPENGVWIDGVKIEDVVDVSVFGSATDIPHVVIRLLPKTLTLGASEPEIDKVADE
jgi:hypothetical protein